MQRDDAEELLLLERSDAPDSVPQRHGDLDVRVVTAAEVCAQGVWIDNWHRMLPVLVATRGLLPKLLLDSVRRCVREPTALSLVKRELSTGDPSLVRGAVFELLRTGRLRALALHCHPLSLHTLLEPVG